MKYYGTIQEIQLKLYEFAEGKNLENAYEIEIKKKRNIKFHRKYWAFVNVIAIEQNMEPDHVNHALKLAIGHYDIIEIKGFHVKYPKSISFAKMDDEEFSLFFEKVRFKAHEIWEYSRETETELLGF